MRNLVDFGYAGRVYGAGERKIPVSREALIDAIVRFSTFGDDFAAELSEVDINPLLVTADAANVLDALDIPRKPG